MESENFQNYSAADLEKSIEKRSVYNFDYYTNTETSSVPDKDYKEYSEVNVARGFFLILS